MGCSSSSFDEFSQTEGYAESMRQFSALRLTEHDVRKLYTSYNQIDVNGSGSITMAELLAHLGLETSPFFVKVFSVFDVDSSGEVDFREFVLTVWNICTLTKHTLDCFTFDVYDPASRGKMTAAEIMQIVYDIYGREEALGSMRLKSIVAELKSMEKEFELITPKRFKAFAKTHQALLFPAFQMQQSLQRKVLGEGAWKKHTKSRSFICDEKYVSIAVLVSSDSHKVKVQLDVTGFNNKVHPIDSLEQFSPSPPISLGTTPSHSNKLELNNVDQSTSPNLEEYLNVKNRKSVTFQCPQGPNPTPRTSFTSATSSGSSFNGSSCGDGSPSPLQKHDIKPSPTLPTTTLRPTSAAPGGYTVQRGTTRDHDLGKRDPPRRLTNNLADVPAGQLDKYVGSRQSPPSAGLASKLKRDSNVSKINKQEKHGGLFLKYRDDSGHKASKKSK